MKTSQVLAIIFGISFGGAITLSIAGYVHFDEQIAALEQKNNVLKENFSELESDKKTVEQALQNAESELDSKHTEISSLNADVNDLNGQISTQINTIDNLRNSVSNAKDDTKTVVSCVGGVLVAIAELERNPLVAEAALYEVSGDCEKASEILEEMDI